MANRAEKVTSSPYNRIAGKSLERIGSLSDCFFAFAMTLIVVDIRLPVPASIHTEWDLGIALWALAPRIVTYLLSFLTLGIFWVGQQTQLSHMTRGDRHLAWIHLGYLAAVAIMPFTTRLLTDFITYRTALVAYWLNIALLAAMLRWSWKHAQRAGLLKEEAAGEVTEIVCRRIVGYQILYAAAMVFCVFGTYWTIGLIVLLQLNSALGLRLPLISRIVN